MCRAIVDLEGLLANAFAQLLAPDLGVARLAALEQDHQGGAFETARYIARMHAFANGFGKLAEDFVGIQNADFSSTSANLSTLTYASTWVPDAGFLRRRFLSRSRNCARWKNNVVGSRFRASCTSLVGSWLFLSVPICAPGRRAVVKRTCEIRGELRCVVAGYMRLCDEFLVAAHLPAIAAISAPLMAAWLSAFEVVHQRQAGHFVIACRAKQFQPGVVDIRNDAFLDQRDRADDDCM